MAKESLQKYADIWKKTLTINNNGDLFESAAEELSEYFNIDKTVAKNRMKTAKEEFAQSWEESVVNPENEHELIDFYNKNDTEIFELMEWHHRESSSQQLSYAAVFKLAKELGYNSYLDFGSGVGSGAILFAKGGFNVSIADISNPLLNFAWWRLQKRNLTAKLYDLKKDTLPDNHFDFITCFDVLEHVKEPIKIIKNLKEKLKSKGIIAVSIVYNKKEQPMHIINDKKLWKKFRYLGFKIIWVPAPACLYVLQKNKPSIFRNIFFLVYDYYLPEWITNIIVKIKSRIESGLSKISKLK